MMNLTPRTDHIHKMYFATKLPLLTTIMLLNLFLSEEKIEIYLEASPVYAEEQIWHQLPMQ